MVGGKVKSTNCGKTITLTKLSFDIHEIDPKNPEWKIGLQFCPPRIFTLLFRTFSSYVTRNLKFVPKIACNVRTDCIKICILICQVQKIHKYTKQPAISSTSAAKSWKRDCDPRKRKHPHLRPRTQWYVETYSKHRRYYFWEGRGTLSPPLSEKKKQRETKTRRRNEGTERRVQEGRRPRARNSLERVSRHNLDKSLIPGSGSFSFREEKKSPDQRREEHLHRLAELCTNVLAIYHTVQSLLECALHFHYWQETFIPSRRRHSLVVPLPYVQW